MKYIYTLLFLIVLSLDGFGQNDSIFALQAKISNGDLEATFNSNYLLDNLFQVKVRVFDVSKNEYLGEYNAYYNNGTLTTKVGSYSILPVSSGEYKIQLKVGLYDQFKNKELKIEFELEGKAQHSNVLSFLND